MKILYLLIAAMITGDAYALTPRYAPGVVSIVEAHDYIQTHRAPNYWKISPYYVGQHTESACSLATATMIVNAALGPSLVYAHQSLATEDELLRRVHDKTWEKGVANLGNGVTLAQMSTILPKALAAYGIKQIKIDTIHVQNESEASKAQLHKALLDSEQSAHTFIVANFDHKFFVGHESVGHFTPIAAFDAEKKRVLIMDPYRKRYEPYWVPEDLLLKAMATKDGDAQDYRGYLVVQLP